jgi:hypothetical protein
MFRSYSSPVSTVRVFSRPHDLFTLPNLAIARKERRCTVVPCCAQPCDGNSLLDVALH